MELTVNYIHLEGCGCPDLTRARARCMEPITVDDVVWRYEDGFACMIGMLHCGKPCECLGDTKEKVVDTHAKRIKRGFSNDIYCVYQFQDREPCERCKFNHRPFDSFIEQQQYVEDNT